MNLSARDWIEEKILQRLALLENPFGTEVMIGIPSRYNQVSQLGNGNRVLLHLKGQRTAQRGRKAAWRTFDLEVRVAHQDYGGEAGLNALIEAIEERLIGWDGLLQGSYVVSIGDRFEGPSPDGRWVQSLQFEVPFIYPPPHPLT